jgi:hypothetical protein
MPDSTEFAIKVTSDDPEKKEEKKDAKKELNGDIKQGEGDELVSRLFGVIVQSVYTR